MIDKSIQKCAFLFITSILGSWLLINCQAPEIDSSKKISNEEKVIIKEDSISKVVQQDSLSLLPVDQLRQLDQFDGFRQLESEALNINYQNPNISGILEQLLLISKTWSEDVILEHIEIENYSDNNQYDMSAIEDAEITFETYSPSKLQAKENKWKLMICLDKFGLRAKSMSDVKTFLSNVENPSSFCPIPTVLQQMKKQGMRKGSRYQLTLRNHSKKWLWEVRYPMAFRGEIEVDFCNK